MPDPRKSLNKRFEKSAQSQQIWEPARMGLQDGVTVAVGDTEPYMIWVVPFKGVPEKVLNIRVPNGFGRLVRVGYAKESSYPTRKQVLGYWDVYADAQFEGITNHAPLHGFDAEDCDWVVGERILMGAAVPVVGENKVDYYPYNKYTPTGWFGSDGATRVDYSTHVPASGVIVCIVVLDITGEIAFRDSAIFTVRSEIYRSDWPDLVAGDNVLFGMYLEAGMTEAFHELNNDNFIDLRLSGATGGGSSVISAISVEDVDGSPSVTNVTKIKFQSGSVTDSGGGVATIQTPDAIAGGASGLMTGADKTKLNGIASGAEVNVNADWNASSGDAQILNKPTLLDAYLITENLTSQITGATDHFDLSVPALSLPNIYCNLRIQPSTITMDADRLGFSLGFTPASPDVLIADYYALAANVLTDDAGVLMYDDVGSYMLEA